MSQGSHPDWPRIEMAQRLLQQNRLDEARAIYQALCTPGQQDADLWLNYAILCRKSGYYEQALAASNQARLLRDDYALAYHVHGSVQQCLGAMEEAMENYRRALVLQPSFAETHYLLGNALQMTGRAEQAAVSYRNAIDLRPDYLEALGNLGAVLMNLHRYDEAQACLQQASQLCPQSVQILCNLGDLALVRDNLDKAESLACSAIKLKPEFVDAHVLLSKVYRKRGDYDRVLECMERARVIQPDNEFIIGSIAEIHEMRGEFDKARELLDPLVGRGSFNPVVLRIFSALARHNGEEEKASVLLENALRRDGLDNFQRIKLHSELGKQYDRLEMYPQAFAHYRQANEDEKQLNANIRSKQGRGFLAKETIGKWSRQFGRDYWQTLSKSGNSSERPVFVIGMPRSGTTLAEQILASHPDVHGAGELPDIPDLASQFKTNTAGPGHSVFHEHLSVQQLAGAAERYLASSAVQAGVALRVIDKMPMNFWHLGFISRLFPRARVIHMKRDPRDICMSIYFQRFDAGMTFTTDLVEIAEYYMAYNRIMDYWYSVLDVNIMDVVYEDLVADQENEIRRMIDFCGLHWDERCLGFYKSGRDVNTPSYDQVRQPMYKRSVGRWRNYRQQLQPLLEALDPGAGCA